MTSHLVSRPSKSSAALLLALLLGCQTPGESTGPELVRGSPELLHEVQPGDIALAPVRNQTEDPKVPVEAIRVAFSRALVERLYSPLDLDYVDGNWIESSFRGTPAPDALLIVAITEWNPVRLHSTGEVRISGEVLLFEGGTTTGRPLWGRPVTSVIDLGDGRGNPPAPSESLLPRAIMEFARDALSALPQRDPVEAHR